MKWFGKIGFAFTKEVEPGITETEIIERECYGEILKAVHKWGTNTGSTNGSIDISNQFSIISDEFVIANLPQLRYLEYQGHLWNITSWEILYPRLILTVGGVYNGEQA